MKINAFFSVTGLLVTCLLCGCAASSGGASDAGPADAGLSETGPSDDTTSGAMDAAGPTRASLCATLQKRIIACGHTHTFPGFTPWCEDESRDDTELLTTCSIRPCALLVECLQTANAPSVGL